MVINFGAASTERKCPALVDGRTILRGWIITSKNWRRERGYFFVVITLAYRHVFLRQVQQHAPRHLVYEGRKRRVESIGLFV